MWGGYGNKPDDKDLGPYNPDAPPVQQFRLPHNVALSKAGLVYVADRVHDRIQVFKRDGTFVREAFVAPKTLLAGSASGLAFSPDQRFVYVIDGANHHVWILLRETLQIVDHIGQQGIFGGSLNVPHALAADSRGNMYVGENFDGRRFQPVHVQGHWARRPAGLFLLRNRRGADRLPSKENRFRVVVTCDSRGIKGPMIASISEVKQRVVACSIHESRIRGRAEQQLDCLGVAGAGGPHQRRFSQIICRVD